MSKLIFIKFLLSISCIFFTSCSDDMKKLELNIISKDTLNDNEYNYYILTLPAAFDKDSHLIIELEPNKDLDLINSIISDPNLYISKTEKTPNIAVNTWKSDRFGDETISISPSYLSPSENFYISVHCKEKCNYILKAQLVKDITIKENEINNFNLNPKTVTKFSFTTRSNFEQLYVNIIGSYINTFSVYLARENPSSINTMISSPFNFNGYRFTINKINNLEEPNTNTKFNLIVDNDDDRQQLTIWFQYNNEKILVKEADILYDSISENKAHCYYYPIDYYNKNKEIILSANLFSGHGFLYIAGYNPVNAESIKLVDISKNKNYAILQNKAILLNKEDYKNFGTFKENEKNYLNFCFFAEKSTSLSMKVYFLENYKRLQALNVIYAGIPVEDIIPKKSVKKYRLEHFNTYKDISINLEQKTGEPKLYLYMIYPEEENIILENEELERLKKNKEILEAQQHYNNYYLILNQESNKCQKNPFTDKYFCYLNAIVECEGDVDCTYSLSFDHKKEEIYMKPKKMYSNVISEKEYDIYKIIISDEDIKNIVIVLIQNTGKTLLRLDSFNSEIGGLVLNEEVQNNEFLPNLIKISNKILNIDNLKGSFTIKVKGLSYASYSLYYYTFNEKENINSLDQDKIDMKLEKGVIIKDIFMDSHRFKIYMYDSSTIGKKNNLFIGLIETDNTNLELYVFKDLNDFSFYEETIHGYLWRGDYKDYIYIDKNDKKYIENDILYIIIFKKINNIVSDKKDAFTSFYLGVTDENTPLLLNEGVEFKYRLNTGHIKQKFYYYFISEDKVQDLLISLTLYYGHVIAKIEIENNYYASRYITEVSDLINIKRSEINKYCNEKQSCGIQIEIQNDNNFLKYSSFLISVRSAKNTPVYLKQGAITKRTILSGEYQHFIVEVKPDKSFGAKIIAFFSNGQGELFVRRVLKSEMFEKTIFPDETNFEFWAGYMNSKNDFYIIEIPYSFLSEHSHYQLLLTVVGVFPSYYSTNIDYSLSISSSLYEIITDTNYQFFISQGEISYFHFKLGPNKKRLYISMTNKDQDANMFLSNDQSISNIFQYQWKSVGTYNEYIDLTINDPYFAEKSIKDLDGDYYLAIQGIQDTYYNLYISSQDVKIITLREGMPGSCSCEMENDNCYFRYEIINNPLAKNIYSNKMVFYTEFTYGSGVICAKVYENGNMDEILNSLPSIKNNDFISDDNSQFLFMNLKKDDPRYTNYSSVIVVGVECKQKSLFDLSAALLDATTDTTRNNNNLIFLKLNKDNIFYLSPLTGLTSKFVYYIYSDKDMNFQVKALYGKAEIHTYTNNTSPIFTLEEKKPINRYHHISDFILDSNTKDKNEYYGTVSELHGYRSYLYIEVKPIDICLINININYYENMVSIPLNKIIKGTVNNYNYYAYFDFKSDIDEVLITVTALDKNKQYNVYLKTNIIKKNETENANDNKYSKASSENFDVKGKTNPLTSALSLRVKNIPINMRNEFNIVRLLINVESFHFAQDENIKILITPVINSVTKIKPEQRMYYFSNFVEINTEKITYTLKNTNKEDNLMIIEISECKGNVQYVLTDSHPLDRESYTELQKRKIPLSTYSSNGKKIIIVKNLEIKEYYLTLYGENIFNELFIEEKDEKQNSTKSKLDLLFFYYTTNEKKYNYLVTQDMLKYENNGDSIELQVPELKKRDALGRENNADSINYSFIISDQKNDFINMESTCFMTKLEQSNVNNKFENLDIQYIKEKNAFIIKGLEGGKTYYMNVLVKNDHNGEIITYKPVEVVFSTSSKTIKTIIIIMLSIIVLVFLYIAFSVYRKYRKKKLQLDFVKETNSETSFNKKIKKLKNIDLDIIKNKYKENDDITDDNDTQKLNSE